MFIYLSYSPDKFKDLVDFLKSYEKDTRTDIWLRDIKPTIFEMVQAIYGHTYGRRLRKRPPWDRS